MTALILPRGRHRRPGVRVGSWTAPRPSTIWAVAAPVAIAAALLWAGWLT